MLPKKIKILIHEYQALFSPSHHTRQVNVLDKLLGLHFVFSVTPTQTVEYLKSRIQSRQGQEGLRIIPAHAILSHAILSLSLVILNWSHTCMFGRELDSTCPLVFSV